MMPNDHISQLQEIKTRMLDGSPSPAKTGGVGFGDALRVGMNLSRMGVSEVAIIEALTHTPDEVCAIAWLKVVDEAAKGAAQIAADETHDKTVVAMRGAVQTDDPPPNWRSPETGKAHVPADVRAWIVRNIRNGNVRNIDCARLFGIASSSVSSIMGHRARNK